MVWSLRRQPPPNGGGGGTQEEAILFVEYLNTNGMNLRLTYSCSTPDVHFLDVTLVGTDSLGVTISPHRKSTATNSILMATSCHPAHVKNLPVGELIRAKQNSTRTEVYETSRRDICHRVEHLNWMSHACSIVDKILREQLLDSSNKNINISKNTNNEFQPTPITFTTSYSLQYWLVISIIKKNIFLCCIQTTISKEFWTVVSNLLLNEPPHWAIWYLLVCSLVQETLKLPGSILWVHISVATIGVSPVATLI